MDLFVALAVFCLVTLFTPGPNNLMLMTSGLNFGVRRGVPHLLGVVLGFWLMVLIVGLGLGAIFEAWPLLYVILFGVFGLASSGTWLGFGAALQRVLKDPSAVRVFHIIMALLLVASLYPIFADGLPAGAP